MVTDSFDTDELFKQNLKSPFDLIASTNEINFK